VDDVDDDEADDVKLGPEDAEEEVAESKAEVVEVSDLPSTESGVSPSLSSFLPLLSFFVLSFSFSLSLSLSLRSFVNSRMLCLIFYEKEKKEGEKMIKEGCTRSGRTWKVVRSGGGGGLSVRRASPIGIFICFVAACT
jgi:hypothetical protein